MSTRVINRIIEQPHMFMRASARVQGCVRIFSSASSAVSYTCCKWYYVIFKIFCFTRKMLAWRSSAPSFLSLFILCAQGEVQSGRPPSRSNSLLPPRPAWRRVSQLSSGSPLKPSSSSSSNLISLCLQDRESPEGEDGDRSAGVGTTSRLASGDGEESSDR